MLVMQLTDEDASDLEWVKQVLEINVWASQDTAQRAIDLLDRIVTSVRCKNYYSKP